MPDALRLLPQNSLHELLNGRRERASRPTQETSKLADEFAAPQQIRIPPRAPLARGGAELSQEILVFQAFIEPTTQLWPSHDQRFMHELDRCTSGRGIDLHTQQPRRGKLLDQLIKQMGTLRSLSQFTQIQRRAGALWRDQLQKQLAAEYAQARLELCENAVRVAR